MRQTILAVLSLSTMAALLTGCGGDLVLLNSKGPVAAGQSNLMMTAIYLMLLVVIPSVKDKNAIKKAREIFLEKTETLKWKQIYTSFSKLQGKDGNEEELFYFSK